MELSSSQNLRQTRKKYAMVTRTRSFGRKLTRSVSFMALKLPETAQTLRRKSTAALKASIKDKRRHFQFNVIVPNGTLKKVTASHEATVSETIQDILNELDAVIVEGDNFGRYHVDCPGMRVHLLLDGSRAPVRTRACSIGLEGETLLIEELPPLWDLKNIESFIAWEKIYISTLLSSVKFYGKPLLKAAIITKREYRLMFQYLEAIAEASSTMLQRMQSYIQSGLLKPLLETQETGEKEHCRDSDDDEKSILNEMVQEGFLTQRDLDISRMSKTCSEKGSLGQVDSYINTQSNKVISQEIHNGSCCDDHKITTDFVGNLWRNVHWEFMESIDNEYDLIPAVRKTKSFSSFIDGSKTVDSILLDDCSASTTPYESIEDLYNSIKNNPLLDEYDIETQDSISTDDYNNDKRTSLGYESGGTWARSDNTESAVSSYFSNFHPSNELNCKETVLITQRLSFSESLQIKDSDAESGILLRQLFCGELMDAYYEYLAVYCDARAYVRDKTKQEDFQALVDIRKGVTCYKIADYLELPVRFF